MGGEISIYPLHSQLNSIGGQLSTARGFEILVGFCSHQGAWLCWTPPRLHRVMSVSMCCAVHKTSEQAAANRQEGFQSTRFSLRGSNDLKIPKIVKQRRLQTRVWTCSTACDSGENLYLCGYRTIKLTQSFSRLADCSLNNDH